MNSKFLTVFGFFFKAVFLKGAFIENVPYNIRKSCGRERRRSGVKGKPVIIGLPLVSK